MDWLTVLTVLGTSGALVAIIEGIKEAFAWKRNRKAQLEDKADERLEEEKNLREAVNGLVESQKKMEESIEALVNANKLMMLDRITHLGLSYIKCGEVTYEQRRFLHEMHDSYHNGLHGNGDADLIIEAVDELPLKGTNG